MKFDKQDLDSKLNKPAEAAEASKLSFTAEAASALGTLAQAQKDILQTLKSGGRSGITSTFGKPMLLEPEKPSKDDPARPLYSGSMDMNNPPPPGGQTYDPSMKFVRVNNKFADFELKRYEYGYHLPETWFQRENRYPHLEVGRNPGDAWATRLPDNTVVTIERSGRITTQNPDGSSTVQDRSGMSIYHVPGNNQEYKRNSNGRTEGIIRNAAAPGFEIRTTGFSDTQGGFTGNRIELPGGVAVENNAQGDFTLRGASLLNYNGRDAQGRDVYTSRDNRYVVAVPPPGAGGEVEVISFTGNIIHMRQNAIETLNSDGSTTVQNSNGTIETRRTAMDGGAVILQRTDGTILTTKPDRSTVEQLLDGRRLRRAANGFVDIDIIDSPAP